MRKIVSHSHLGKRPGEDVNGLKKLKTGARRNKLLCYSGIALACCLCYSNCLTGDLVHDDIYAIQTNPDVQGERPWMEVFEHDFWGKSMQDTTSHKSYRPLCTLTFRFNYYLHELHTFGYHFVNFVLHILVSLLFTTVCELLVFTHWHASVVAGFLFAVHPIHTEAVTGIVGRADVLACFLFLSSLLCYHRFCQNESSSPFQLTRRLPWLGGCIVCGTMATFSKETGITVFGVCVVYDVYRSRDELLRVLKNGFHISDAVMSLSIRLACLVIQVAVILSLRLSVLHGQLPRFTVENNPASFSNSTLTRSLTYCYLASFNLRLLLVPVTLSYDWQVGSIPLVDSLTDVRNLETLLAATIMATLCFKAVNSKQESLQKPVVIGLALLIVPFMPASNIFFTVGFVVAERILYMPSLGYCILVTHGLTLLLRMSTNSIRGPKLSDSNNNMQDACTSVGSCTEKEDLNILTEADVHELHFQSRREKVLLAAVMFIILFLSVRTFRRNEVWQSRESLFRSGVDTLPHNAKAHYNYANFLKDNKRTDAAIAHYSQSIRLYPEYASAHNNLATLLQDDERAMKHLMLALKYEPNHYKALFNLAGIYKKKNALSKAKEALEKCLRLSPSYTDALLVYAQVLQGMKSFSEAEAVLRLAISENPANADIYNNLGVLFGDLGRSKESIGAYNEALRINRNHSVVLLNLGRQYKYMGLKMEAETALRRSIAVEASVSAYEALGILLYQENRFQESRAIFAEAVKVEPENWGLLKNYALAIEACGELDRALQLLEQRCKDDKCPLEILYLRLNMMTSTRSYQKILDLVDDWLASHPNDAELLVAKGHAHRELQDLEKAIICYKNAIALNPNHFRAHSSLGGVYHIQRKYESALKHYNKAFDIGPDDRILNDNLAKLHRIMQRNKRRDNK